MNTRGLLCAHCGAPLRKACIALIYRGLERRPAVGWCFAESGSCWQDDPVAMELLDRDRPVRDLKHLAELLDEVDARGSGRVQRSDVKPKLTRVDRENAKARRRAGLKS